MLELKSWKAAIEDAKTLYLQNESGSSTSPISGEIAVCVYPVFYVGRSGSSARFHFKADGVVRQCQGLASLSPRNRNDRYGSSLLKGSCSVPIVSLLCASEV